MERSWFEQHGWPLSTEVSAIWSERPEDWRPINHSCDPSVWLSGLDSSPDVTSPADEELTIDYATLCGPGMAAFACACGTAACRGTVRSSDSTLPELARRYGSHVSDVVLAGT